MILTPSDIGATPQEVEKSLTKMFKRAMSWNTILLIDEADVFMERRSTSDLLRNSLVAGKCTWASLLSGPSNVTHNDSVFPSSSDNCSF